MLPQRAFYGRGADKGPLIATRDDSSAERNALHSVWPDTNLLLCSFHFPQRKWTWLHDGKNRIANTDRAFLINKTKCLVNAKSETRLVQLYEDFQKCSVVSKYPNYLSYAQSQWERRKEWALCYRKHLLVRGNQTNNYAEASTRILKDLVFSRLKAYNLVQMFTFVTECLELYYSRKILSAAHNRYEHHVSLKFQGINCSGIYQRESDTTVDRTHGTYLVSSQTECGVQYLVDMKLGVCSCNAGQDGSPCSHQAAVVNHFHVPSVNCIPSKGNCSTLNIDNLVEQIEEFTEDITKRVKENSLVAQGMQTILKRYKNLTESSQFQSTRLSSSLHRFGWVFGGTIKRTQGGHLHRGRRISVNAASAGRRRKSASKGKGKLPTGRPKGLKEARYPIYRYIMPNRKPAPGKRLHSLQHNVQHGTQNGGKW